MTSTEEEQEKQLELIRIVDKLIAEGQWEGSLFFEIAGKKLRDLRDRLNKKLELMGPSASQKNSTLTNNQPAISHSGLIEIYISLYNAEGNNLKKWEIILASLNRQIVSRPIYKKEKDIADIIKAKNNTMNDGYAIAYVSETDIMRPQSALDKIPIDRYGHELITLKEHVLKPENITKFVHVTGEYSFQHGVLRKLGN